MRAPRTSLASAQDQEEPQALRTKYLWATTVRKAWRFAIHGNGVGDGFEIALREVRR